MLKATRKTLIYSTCCKVRKQTRPWHSRPLMSKYFWAPGSGSSDGTANDKCFSSVMLPFLKPNISIFTFYSDPTPWPAWTLPANMLLPQSSFNLPPARKWASSFLPWSESDLRAYCNWVIMKLFVKYITVEVTASLSLFYWDFRTLFPAFVVICCLRQIVASSMYSLLFIQYHLL